MRGISMKLGAAAVLIALAVGAALGLNVDQNRTMVARQNSTQQTSYYRFTINYNDPNISTAQAFGKLLQNTFISRLVCHVTTAFNAGTTNVVTVGTSTAATELIDNVTTNGKLTPGSTGIYDITSAAKAMGINATSDADHNLYAKYTQTGGAATAGAVTCVLEFEPNNDM